MKIEVLKQLIDVEAKRVNSVADFKTEVFRLLDLYQQDNLNNNVSDNGFIGGFGITTTVPHTTIFSDNCPCNPKNGGGGICGCTLGSKLVSTC